MQYIIGHKIPNERIFLYGSVSVLKAGTYPYPRWRELSPLGATSLPLAYQPLSTACAQTHHRHRGRQDRTHPQQRNARRTECESSNPPRFRAFRRGGICMLRHTNRNSSAKWEGHLKWRRERSRRLWSVVKESAQRANICNFGIYL